MSNIRSDRNSTKTPRVSSTSSRIQHSNRKSTENQGDIHYIQFPLYPLLYRVEKKVYVTITCCSSAWAHVTHIESRYRFLRRNFANVASSSDSMKPTFQHHHGDGTSFLRGPAPLPVVRNSSVVLIMLISFFFPYFISIAYFTAEVNGTYDWKDCFLSVDP